MRGEAGARDLQAEGGVTLLEHKVPDVQGPVHLGGEENRWPHRAPGTISEISHVVPVGSQVSPVRDPCGWEGWTACGAAALLLQPRPGSRVSLLGRKFFLVSDF